MTYAQQIGGDRIIDGSLTENDMDTGTVPTLGSLNTWLAANTFNQTVAIDGTVGGQINFEGSVDTSPFTNVQVDGDTVPRLVETADGKHTWGPGNAAADLVLERAFTAGMRITADQLQLFNRAGSPGTFQGITVRPGLTTSPVFAVSVVGDGANRYRFDATGDMNWGDGVAEDTRLARVGVGQLQTFGDFGVSGVLQAYAGTVNRVTTHIANFSPDPENDHTLLITPPLGGLTATIVATPAQGSTLFFKDISGTASINPITIVSADADPIDGAASFVINQDFGAVELRYGANQWNVVSSYKM